MKKLLASIVFTVGVLIAAVFSWPQAGEAALVNYYQLRNIPMPSIEQRALLAFDCGMDQYTGTLAQNIRLETCLKDQDGGLGFSVATGYQKTLRSTMDTTQTYIPMSSMYLPDGTYLDPTQLGSQIFVMIEPGKTKQEIAVCTSLSTSTLNFTGCTRGLGFQGTSLVAVSGNAKTHTAGSFASISNTHYVYEQFVDKDTQETASGTKRFASNELIFGDGTLIGSKKFYFCDTVSTSTCGYIGATPSTTNPGYLDFVLSPNGSTEFSLTASGTILSTGLGISITGGAVSFNPAATSTGGLGFIGSQAAVATSSGGGITNCLTGLCVATSTNFTWTGKNTFTSNTFFTATNTFSGQSIFATTTAASSTVTTLNVNTLNVLNANVNGSSLNGLATNSTTSALDYHYHPSQCEVQSLSYGSGDTVAAGASVYFPHRLGTRPSMITINAMAAMPTERAWSHGTWTSSTFIAQFAEYSNTIRGSSDDAITATVIQLINSDATVESSATVITPTNTTYIGLLVGTNVNTAPNSARRFTATLCK